MTIDVFASTYFRQVERQVPSWVANIPWNINEPECKHSWFSSIHDFAVSKMIAFPSICKEWFYCDWSISAQLFLNKLTKVQKSEITMQKSFNVWQKLTLAWFSQIARKIMLVLKLIFTHKTLGDRQLPAAAMAITPIKLQSNASNDVIFFYFGEYYATKLHSGCSSLPLTIPRIVSMNAQN